MMRLQVSEWPFQNSGCKYDFLLHECCVAHYMPSPKGKGRVALIVLSSSFSTPSPTPATGEMLYSKQQCDTCLADATF